LALSADAAAHAAQQHERAGERTKKLESLAWTHWLSQQINLHSPAILAIDTPLPLSDREREISLLVGEGLTNRQIADRLAVSVRTIEGHLYRIFAKLGIDRRQQLAALFAASIHTPQAPAEIRSTSRTHH
jgi:DNA-binding CsgD family transcriptional regulator